MGCLRQFGLVERARIDPPGTGNIEASVLRASWLTAALIADFLHRRRKFLGAGRLCIPGGGSRFSWAWRLSGEHQLTDAIFIYLVTWFLSPASCCIAEPSRTGTRVTSQKLTSAAARPAPQSDQVNLRAINRLCFVDSGAVAFSISKSPVPVPLRQAGDRPFYLVCGLVAAVRPD